MKIRDSDRVPYFLYIYQMKKIMQEKNQVVPDKVLSKKFLSQFKTEADISKFLKQLHAQVLKKCSRVKWMSIGVIRRILWRATIPATPYNESCMFGNMASITECGTSHSFTITGQREAVSVIMSTDQRQQNYRHIQTELSGGCYPNGMYQQSARKDLLLQHLPFWFLLCIRLFTIFLWTCAFTLPIFDSLHKFKIFIRTKFFLFNQRRKNIQFP